MKYSYVKHIPFRTGEITIVHSKSAAESMAHSCELAKAFYDLGIGTLLVNTGLTKGRFQDAAETSGINWAVASLGVWHPHKNNAPLVVHSTCHGNVSGEFEMISEVMAKCQSSVLILSAWEWCSSSWRRKEDLLYRLREFIDDGRLAVIIYANTRTKPELGVDHRGGVGKLSTLAFAVTSIDEARELEGRHYFPVPRPIDAHIQEIHEAGAQLVANEINNLEGVILPLPEEEKNNRIEIPERPIVTYPNEDELNYCEEDREEIGRNSDEEDGMELV